jgi:hypothetical protein
MILFFGIILSAFSSLIAIIMLLSLAGYFGVAFVSTMPARRLDIALLGAAGVMLSHIVYGFAFIRGLTVKQLDK